MITYPLNNIDYTAEDAELFHCTRTSGIWAEDSFSISVTGADNNVTIGKGIAWINNEEFAGKVAALKTTKTLDLDIADSTYPRIDVVAIQFNANNNATDVIVKKGIAATNPIRPAITRTGSIYELYLASIYRPTGSTVITAGNITDLRLDKSVCGLMADSVTRIDTSAINAQILSLIETLNEEIENTKELSGLMFESEWTENGFIPLDKGGTGADLSEIPTGAILTKSSTDKLTHWNAVPIDHGGTGATTVEGARKNLGLGAVATENILPIANGGTGATTTEDAKTNLGLKKKLWSGTWSSGTVEIPNTSDYFMYMIDFVGHATPIFVGRNGNYIRGAGGYAATSTIELYNVTITRNGNLWTLEKANRLTLNPNASNGGVVDIPIENIWGIV